MTSSKSRVVHKANKELSWREVGISSEQFAKELHPSNINQSHHAGDVIETFSHLFDSDLVFLNQMHIHPNNPANMTVNKSLQF